jgi:hypothetical protein
MLEPIRALDPIRMLSALARDGNAGAKASEITDAVRASLAGIGDPSPPAVPDGLVAIPDAPDLLALIRQGELAMRGAGPASAGVLAGPALPAGVAEHTPAAAADPGHADIAGRQAATIAGIDSALAALAPSRPATLLTGLQAVALAELEVAIVALNPARAALVGDPAAANTLLPNQQIWALAGIERALAALMAPRARTPAALEHDPSLSAYRTAILATDREPPRWGWDTGIGGSRVRRIWPCADGHVLWSLHDDPIAMRAMVDRLVEDGSAGPLGAVDWEAVRISDIPRQTQLAWEAPIAAWFVARTRAVLTALSERHDLGLLVIGDVGDLDALLVRARIAVTGLQSLPHGGTVPA